MRKKMRFGMLVVVVLAAPVVFCATEAEKAAVVTAWNEYASSDFMSSERLSSFGEDFPAWRIQQVTWPSKAEIEKHRVEASDKLKSDCVTVIRQIVKPEHVPTDVKDHLVAMNDWGIPYDRKPADLHADVFVVRYRMGSCVIHVQQALRSAYVVIADEDLAAKAKGDPEAYMREVWSKYINPERPVRKLAAVKDVGTAVHAFRPDYGGRGFGIEIGGPPHIDGVLTDKQFVLFSWSRILERPSSDLTPRF